MGKNYNSIIQQIERKVKNGDYNHADNDDVELRRGTRSRLKPSRFIDTQSSVESSLHRKKNKKKKTSTTQRISHNNKRKILYDSEDEDDESRRCVRRDHIERVRRNMMANRQQEYQIDEHQIDVTDTFSVEHGQVGGRNYIPISRGGETFCLREELNNSSDDDDEGILMQNTREKVVASYNHAQITKREAAFSQLQSMREANEFDDEVSSDDDDGVAVKASVTGNHNVVNINNIRYTIPMPLSYGQQQQHDGLLNIQSASWQPSLQRQYNPFGYSWDQSMQAQYITHPQPSPFQSPSFPLQSSNHLTPNLTPIRTRNAEMNIRGIIEQWRSSGISITDNQWLDRFECILDRKLRGLVTGNFLSSSDSDWIRNERRNRSGNRSRLQLDLISRLMNLRIN